MENSQLNQIGEDRRALIKKLDAAGWGILLIWIGVAFLADVGWGVGLLGIGIIVLAIKMGRKHFGLPIEGFGLLVGILFVVAGGWELLGTKLHQEPIPGGLMPALSIVVGVVLVVSALLHKRR